MRTPPDEYVKRALQNFHEGYSCSQAVFAAFAPELGIGRHVALRLASGLGAGVGRLREVCGAFTGFTLVAGYLRGNDDPTTESKERSYQLIQHYAESFRSEFGALRCGDLLPLKAAHSHTPRPELRSEKYYSERPCEHCVAFCAHMAAQLLCEVGEV